MIGRRFHSLYRRHKLLGALMALVIAPLPVQAMACGAVSGTLPVAQIESGASLYVFSGFGQLDVTGTAGTATTANSWRVGWYGGAGVTHFSGRMIDSEGGTITLEDITSGTTTQPTPDELDFEQTFDLDTEQGVEYLDFVSTSRTIGLYLNADAYYIISYPIPGDVEGHPQANPFGLSFDATPTTIPNTLDTQFCDGFE
jgi:hypothetical protein